MLATSTQGKTNYTNDEDVDSDSVEFGPDVDEEALIAEKTEIERTLFSNTDHYLVRLCPQQGILGPIILESDSRMDLLLYHLKP